MFKLTQLTLKTALLAGATILLLLSLVGFFPKLSYPLDDLSQFRLVYACMQIALIITCLFTRLKSGTLIAAAGLALNMIEIVPLYSFSKTAQSPNISIASLNLWGDRNKQHQKVITYIRAKHPDILCVNEISPLWMRELQKGIPEYKYQFDQGNSGGSAIFSKIPIERISRPAGVRWYGVRGVVTVQNTDITVIAEHPPAPFKYSNWLHRNEEFERLSADAVQMKTPLVLIGDLNSTSWSPYFKQLLQSSGLFDTENGNGLQPSWSTNMGIALIAIDHCLISNQLLCTKRLVGPYIGSDHLPVYVELAIANKQ